MDGRDGCLGSIPGFPPRGTRIQLRWCFRTNAEMFCSISTARAALSISSLVPWGCPVDFSDANCKARRYPRRPINGANAPKRRVGHPGGSAGELRRGRAERVEPGRSHGPDLGVPHDAVAAAATGHGLHDALARHHVPGNGSHGTPCISTTHL